MYIVVKYSSASKIEAIISTKEKEEAERVVIESLNENLPIRIFVGLEIEYRNVEKITAIELPEEEEIW